MRWNIPNAMQAVIPGFEAFATTMMRKTIKNKGVAEIGELRGLCLEAGRQHDRLPDDRRPLRLQADEFIPEVKEYVGAATFLPMAKDADVSLFI